MPPPAFARFGLNLGKLRQSNGIVARVRRRQEVKMFARLLILFKATGRDIVVLWYACRNAGTPLVIKICAVLMAVYVVSPVDLITDALPILGWVDDMALLAIGVPAILKRVPPSIMSGAQAAAERLLSRWAFWRG
jgi:uncharacterized membrane protein YkvA (DUF1232 family)